MCEHTIHHNPTMNVLHAQVAACPAQPASLNTQACPNDASDMLCMLLAPALTPDTPAPQQGVITMWVVNDAHHIASHCIILHQLASNAHEAHNCLASYIFTNLLYIHKTHNHSHIKTPKKTYPDNDHHIASAPDSIQLSWTALMLTLILGGIAAMVAVPGPGPEVQPLVVNGQTMRSRYGGGCGSALC